MTKKVLYLCAWMLMAPSVSFSKNIAILMGYSCEQDESAFGMSFYNWRVGLRTLGWSSEVFCGPPTDGTYSERRELRDGTVLDALSETTTRIQAGDNFLLIINNHGTEKRESIPGASGQMLHGYDENGESCPMIPMNEVAEELELIDHKNGSGVVWVLNSSCHSGAFIQDLSDNSSVCVATNSGIWSESWQEDYMERIGWNMANLGGYQAKNFNYMKDDPQRLEQRFSSYKMKNVLAEAIAQDKVTMAIYTNGLGLNHLNVDEYEKFENVAGEMANPEEKSILLSQKRLDEGYEKKVSRGVGVYFAHMPARAVRNKIMSRIISSSADTACSDFNLDRRSRPAN